jgi:Ulp1 family protease
MESYPLAKAKNNPWGYTRFMILLDRIRFVNKRKLNPEHLEKLRKGLRLSQESTSSVEIPRLHRQQAKPKPAQKQITEEFSSNVSRIAVGGTDHG